MNSDAWDFWIAKHYKNIGRLTISKRVTFKVMEIGVYVLLVFLAIRFVLWVVSEDFESIVRANGPVINTCLTAILVLITLLYVIYTGRYVTITSKLLKETVIGRQMSYRPAFIIKLDNVEVSTITSLGTGKNSYQVDIRIDLYNYSKSLALEPRLAMRYTEGSPSDNLVSTETLLRSVIKIDGEQSTTISTALFVHKDYFALKPIPGLHVTFHYQDVERNLYIHDVLLFIAKQNVANVTSYFSKPIQESLFIINSHDRENLLDTEMAFFELEYHKGTRVFSRRTPFS